MQEGFVNSFKSQGLTCLPQVCLRLLGSCFAIPPSDTGPPLVSNRCKCHRRPDLTTTPDAQHPTLQVVLTEFWPAQMPITSTSSGQVLTPLSPLPAEALLATPLPSCQACLLKGPQACCLSQAQGCLQAEASKLPSCLAHCQPSLPFAKLQSCWLAVLLAYMLAAELAGCQARC